MALNLAPFLVDLFNWLDVFLACGLVTILLAQLMTASAGKTRFMSGALRVGPGGCAALLLLMPALPNRLSADAFPGLDHSQSSKLVFGRCNSSFWEMSAFSSFDSFRGSSSRAFDPKWLLAGSFVALILLGNALVALADRRRKRGLASNAHGSVVHLYQRRMCHRTVVRDTATDFSALGQLIILALFQVGGLGIVTFVAFVSVFSAKALPVSQMVAFRQMISATEMEISRNDSRAFCCWPCSLRARVR